MDMVFAPLRSNLRSILQAIPSLPEIAWEARKFTPNPDLPYISERLMPLGNTPATLGSQGFTREDVVYALTLRYPSVSTRLTDMENVADLLQAHFTTGRGVGSPTVNGRIMGVNRMSVVEDAARYHLPVRIRLFVYRLTAPTV